jgi:hypothetical protein
MKKIIKIEVETVVDDNNMIKANLLWRLRDFKILNIDVEDLKDDKKV